MENTENTGLFEPQIMMRLFEELWMESRNCSEEIEHIGMVLFEVSKSTGQPKKTIRFYFNFLVNNQLIELISTNPLLYLFTEKGREIRTNEDIEKILKTIA